MNLNERITIYEPSIESDGTGGQVKTLNKVVECWANVKPMSGNLALNFQQLTGTQGYEVTVRTDFNIVFGIPYEIEWEAIHGTQKLLVNVVQQDKNYTILICRSENRV